MLDILFFISSALIAIIMITYATWLLFHRLLSKEPKLKTFREWIKSVFEAIWGL